MEGRQWLHAREKRLLADPHSEPWPAVCRDHLDLRRGTPLSAPELFLAGTLCVRGPLSRSLSPPFPGQGGWLRPSSVLPPSMCGLLFSGGLSPIVWTTPRGPCDSEGVTEVCSPAGETRVQQGSPRGSLPVPGLCSGPHTGLSLTGPSESYSAQHGLVTGSAIGGPPGGSLSPRTSTQLRQDVGSRWPAIPPHSACPAGSPPPGGGA